MDNGFGGANLPSSLARPFRLIAFDWDGTAVTNRWEDATPVRCRLEALLRLGVWIVIITGTNVQNIDRQLTSAIVGPHKRRLYVCTNRGSEVYTFDAESQPALVWRRVATPEEDRQLTDVADEVRQAIKSRTGLQIDVIYDRPNRRKIDLIPLPAWANPPKAALGELLRAVEDRLARAGLSGGLRELFQLAEAVARQQGLRDARITSDVKHIEVGLTNKGDSIAWIMRELAASQDIPAGDILIVGDEFGPIAGFEGSDQRMVIPAAAGATFVSVGPEPNGVPPEVIHLGGGPARFLELLDQQIRLHEAKLGVVEHPTRCDPTDRGTVHHQPLPSDANPPSTTSTPSTSSTPLPDNGWLLIDEGFDPAREHEIESLFTVANGYVGTRGSLAEGSSASRPATFVAGVFRAPRQSIRALLLAPDWARIKVFIEGQEIRLDRGRTLEHRRVLDMQRGVLERFWRQSDDIGRITRLHFCRFVSLADRHALVEWVTVIPENYSGRLSVESVVDASRESAAGTARVSVAEAPIPRAQAIAVGSRAPTMSVLVVSPHESTTTLAFATTSVFHDGGDLDVQAEHATLKSGESAGDRWSWTADIGARYRVDKLVAVYTSRDLSDPVRASVQHLSDLVERGADSLLQENVRAWAERHATADVEIGGDAVAQRAMRLAVYHLIGSANPEDARISIGARALTGQAYLGHIFWDTEIYMLPFYVFTHPPSARALLMYRYETLPAARRRARALGYKGALYPWESTDIGEEATPPYALAPDGEMIPILSGLQEHHISADVAYAVWQYWQATSDDAFFVEAGAEIMLATAQFWASRVVLGEDGRYHILKVIGPDEYHESVDDDAYTNAMAQWNLEHGVETAQRLRKRWPERWIRLSRRLRITIREVDEWLAIARKMYTGLDPTTGLIEQFRGYFDLEQVDLESYEPRTAPMDVLLGRERTARTQIIKQPDVIMLIYLLWDQFSPQVREVNFRYYEPRCGHGSSLSPSIHALVAARLGDLTLAERYFRQAAEIDLADNMGNAAGGVHAGAEGGLWQSAVFGFGGMRLRTDGLAFDPHLLPSWQSLGFPVLWRGRQVLALARAIPAELDVVLESGDSMTIAVGPDDGEQARATTSRRYRARKDDGAWHSWEEMVP